MIETEPINMSMKEQVEEIRRKYNHNTASHAFASLYIWKKEMKLTIHLEDDMFAVKSEWKGHNAWFFPCGSEEAVCSFIDMVLKEEGLIFCYMREEDVSILNRHFPDTFGIRECEMDNEYIYSREEQVNLSGRRFAKIRNHINRAVADHTLECEILSDDNISNAIQINDEWIRQSDSPEGLEDINASEIMLSNWKDLDVHGIIILVDGSPFAVVAGYAINDSVYDMSLAKQKYMISGISTYAKHMFILNLPETVKEINAEEDLGIPGLRMMKHQMQPSGIIKMYEGMVDMHDEE